MTYCVAARLESGLVFLSDSRTNAGVDQISVFRKMTVFERPGERVMVLMTSGNLAVSQAVLNVLTRQREEGADTLWNVPDMFAAARLVGAAVREVYRSEADAGKSPRGKGIVGKYLNDKGFRILAALDAVAGRTGAAHAEIALAWIAAQPAVAAPIASATSVEQVKSLVRGARLELSAADLKELTDAGK